jgi:hypothetical protein
MGWIRPTLGETEETAWQGVAPQEPKETGWEGVAPTSSPFPMDDQIKHLPPEKLKLLMDAQRMQFSFVELSPFPLDEWHEDQIKHLPPEKQAEQRSHFSSVMYELARPWMDLGYSAASGLNRGLASLATEMDQVVMGGERYLTGKTTPYRWYDIDWKKSAQAYEENADWWKNQLPKEGVRAFDKVYRFTGEAAGGVLPSMSQFLMDWGSGLTIPYMAGTEESRTHGTDPVIGGVVKAIEVGLLGTMFRMVAPLKSWLQASILGTYFGTENALLAPPGERGEAFAKGVATGGILGLTSPSGRWGLRDIYPEIAGAAPKPAPTPPEITGLRPAIQQKDGSVVQGVDGGTHTDIVEGMGEQAVSLEELNRNPKLADHVLEKPELYMPAVIDRAAKLKGEGEPTPDEEGAPAEPPESGRGFLTPDGKFLDREQAKDWVKENEPEIYGKWAGVTGDEGAEFHSEDYNQAREQVGQADPDLSELTKNLRGLSPDSPLEERVSLADRIRKTYTGVQEGIRNSLSEIKSTSAALWDWYKHPERLSDIRAMIDRYKGAKEISAMRGGRFARAIQETYSDRTQRAMSAYVQADGDEATLRKWSENTSDSSLKQKYDDALKLTKEQKGFVQDYRRHMDAMLDRAIESGTLEHGIENYVPQIWEKPDENPAARRLQGESNAGLLRKNPFFAKKRIYESMFEGEQAGHTSKDSRLGYLVSAWHQAFDEGLNARAFIHELTNMDASDGRPMAITSGTGTPLPKDQRPASAFLVNPNAVGYKVTQTDPVTGKPMKDPVTGETLKQSVDVSDYSNRGIDHPALREWKWATSDNEGNPIFVQGDLKLHPEAYEDVRRFLGTSAIRQSTIGRAVLRGAGELKGTMLGFFSPFHQVHLGVTAVFHGASPFRPPAIDLENPRVRARIEHGLKLYEGSAMTEWQEGLAGPGLIKYIPKVGEYAERYTEYQFGLDGYIPRLKNYMAEVFEARNRSRYPELSEDEVLKLTGDQVNATFGHQNWRGMAANKTFQDSLRIAALAPDFLISRARQVGQALRPYGREQFTALAIRGAVGMYIASKTIEGIISLIDPEKNEVHWDRPFSVTVDSTEYSLRSEVGDVYHMLRDPRGFVYYRLNPFIAKPAIEAITGRDRFGRLRDPLEQLKDWATSAVPIAGQGYFTKQDYPLYQSILQSLGITTWSARTEAEKTAREITAEKSKVEEPPVTKKRMEARSQLKKDFEETGDFNPIRQAWHEGKITVKDAQWITNRTLKGDLESMVDSFTVPESLKVWKDATQEERVDLQPVIVMKWYRWQENATPAELQAYQSDMNEVAAWKPTRPLKQGKRRFSQGFSIVGK